MDEIIKKDREPKYYNLKKTGRQALTELKNNSEIRIRAADKGGGIVIMDKNYYRTMMLIHVEDTESYKALKNNAVKETRKTHCFRHKVHY